MNRPLLLIALVACGTPAPTLDGGTTDGGVMAQPNAQTVGFEFATSHQISSDPTPARPSIGNLYVSIYLSSDVGPGGPAADAGEVTDFAIDNVDLSSGACDAGYVVGPLQPGTYSALAILDTNDDGGSRPSTDDLVTVPDHTMIDFTIVDGGAQVKKTVVLDLIYPF